jgi:hypothetical protein
MNDEGLADAAALTPFVYPGITHELDWADGSGDRGPRRAEIEATISLVLTMDVRELPFWAVPVHRFP